VPETHPATVPHRIVPVLQVVPVLRQERRLPAQRNEDRGGLLELTRECVQLGAQTGEHARVRRVGLRHERIAPGRHGAHLFDELRAKLCVSVLQRCGTAVDGVDAAHLFRQLETFAATSQIPKREPSARDARRPARSGRRAAHERRRRRWSCPRRRPAWRIRNSTAMRWPLRRSARAARPPWCRPIRRRSTTPAMLAMMPFFVLRRSISPWSSAIFRFDLLPGARGRGGKLLARGIDLALQPTPAVHRSSPAVVPGSERRRRRPHRLEARPGHPGDERGAGPRHVECKRGHLRGNLPILVQDQQIARLGRKLLLCGEGAIPVDRRSSMSITWAPLMGAAAVDDASEGEAGCAARERRACQSPRSRRRRWTAARAKPGREGFEQGLGMKESYRNTRRR